MRAVATPLPGVVRLAFDRHRDERGWFERAYCADALAAAGFTAFAVAQANLSHNIHALTLRGLHYQEGDPPESKIVRVLRGRAFDVVADLRRDSPTRHRWVAVELSAESGEALFIPAGCAHGFLTLESDTDLLYLMGAPYDPAAQRGVRWDDPTLAVDWPEAPRVVSERDRGLPTLT